ncbi:MAG: F0F1 ATP synthase subunit B [Acetatifactor sp.]|nr:F0F1 ATP synthase subunit B [Acetatifactor sp.]
MLRLDMNVVWTVINLLILYLLVRRFLFKPVRKILDDRQAEIDKQYAAAKQAQDTAEEMKKQYEQSFAGIEEEKSAILTEARELAHDEYEKMIEDAKEQAVKIKADAKKAADIQQERYLQQARDQIADLVVAATAKLVASRQDEEADRELYDQFIAKTGEKE